MKRFVVNPKHDWWVNYVMLNDEYTKNLCRSALAEANGEGTDFSITLAKASKKVLENYEREILESAENAILWE